MGIAFWRSLAPHTDDQLSDSYEDPSSDSDWSVYPGDRIGALPKTSRTGPFRRLALALIVVGATAIAYHNPSLVAGSWATLTAAVSGAADRAGRSPQPAPLSAAGPRTEPAAAPAPAVAAAEPPASTLPVAAAVPETPPAALPEKTVSAPPIAAAAIAPSAPADPLRKRAQAAGLHPDLSPTLLAQLSDADYKNAGTAIETALAETADDDALYWPRERKVGLALFKVHFVPGAEPDCRRYVVTVAKNGWQTTSLPLEKCGVRRRETKRG